MGCKKLQLPDYFQLVKNDPITYRAARCIYDRLIKKVKTSMTRVPPRQSGAAGNLPVGASGDSLKGLSYSRINYDYHINGQLAQAVVYPTGRTATMPVRATDYDWDGLALIKRGDTEYTNDPAVTGGNPILASRRGVKRQSVLFNDMLGTTLSVTSRGSRGSTYVSTQLTAFGEPITPNAQRSTTNEFFFTGKPKVEGLGYAFLFRNYRSELGKFVYELTKEPATESEAMPNGNCKTADPLGYPDGWNNLAYVNNGVTSAIDWLGGVTWIPDPATESVSDNRIATNKDWTVTYTSSTQSGYGGDWVQVIERRIIGTGWHLLRSGTTGSHELATSTTLTVTNAITCSATLNTTVTTEIKASASPLFGVTVGGSFSVGIGINTSTSLCTGYVIFAPAGKSGKTGIISRKSKIRISNLVGIILASQALKKE